MQNKYGNAKCKLIAERKIKLPGNLLLIYKITLNIAQLTALKFIIQLLPTHDYVQKKANFATYYLN